MTQETWKLAAGTKVRTMYGEDAELLVEWCSWEASVTVVTASGRTDRYHPCNLYIDGKPLPYQP